MKKKPIKVETRKMMRKVMRTVAVGQGYKPSKGVWILWDRYQRDLVGDDLRAARFLQSTKKHKPWVTRDIREKQVVRNGQRNQ